MALRLYQTALQLYSHFLFFCGITAKRLYQTTLWLDQFFLMYNHDVIILPFFYFYNIIVRLLYETA